MPNVLLEAMARGVPVVATRVGGVPELVIHGETGLLAEPGNAESVAASLCQLLGSGELRSRLSEAALRRVRQEHACDVW